MSKLFDTALETIKNNLTRQYNCIPFTFDRFSNYLPGIQQQKYTIISAASGVGKSQITDFMYVMTPYNFIKENETDIKVKIFYYSLEEDKQSKILKWMSARLYSKYGIIISTEQLQSMGKYRCSQETIDCITECKDYFYELEDILTIHDEGINPYGIFKALDTYAKANGQLITKDYDIIDNSTGEVKETIQKFDRYIPNDPNEYKIVIVDHASLISTEKGLDKHASIGKLSNELLLLRNKYSYSPVLVQQQSADVEKKQFTNSGQSIESKLEPSLDHLGDNKMTARDANIVLGLFAPNRYGITSWRGYNVGRLGDNFRDLSILKNRSGISNVKVGLYFNGATGYFKEYPKAKEMTEDIYKKIEDANKN